MGRKSSVKGQARVGPPPPTSPPPKRPFTTWVAVAVVAAVIVGALAYARRGEPSLMSAPPQAPAPSPAGAQAPVPSVVDPPRFALFGPHSQPNLPPLPFDYGPPARPAEVVRAVYRFAAEHPEVLGYVPCYCGCEREGGHRGNDDCFVAARNTAGDVTQWDPHGVT